DSAAGRVLMRLRILLVAAVASTAACSLLFDWNRYEGSPGAIDASGYEGATQAEVGADDAGTEGGEDTGSDGGVKWGDLSNPFAWETYNLTNVNVGLAGFAGGAYDGTYVYLAGNPVARHDVGRRLDDPNSWSYVSLTPWNAGARAFIGASFDGRYVYFGSSDTTHVVARFDTTQEFQEKGSWSFFDL